MKVTDEMVDRFLSWRLPITAMPDACVMDRSHDRMGTHVLSFTEAKAMLEHVLAGCDESKSGGDPELLAAALHFLVTFNNMHYGRVPDEVDAARNRLAAVLRDRPSQPHKPNSPAFCACKGGCKGMKRDGEVCRQEYSAGGEK